MYKEYRVLMRGVEEEDVVVPRGDKKKLRYTLEDLRKSKRRRRSGGEMGM